MVTLRRGLEPAKNASTPSAAPVPSTPRTAGARLPWPKLVTLTRSASTSRLSTMPRSSSDCASSTVVLVAVSCCERPCFSAVTTMLSSRVAPPPARPPHRPRPVRSPRRSATPVEAMNGRAAGCAGGNGTAASAKLPCAGFRPRIRGCRGWQHGEGADALAGRIEESVAGRQPADMVVRSRGVRQSNPPAQGASTIPVIPADAGMTAGPFPDFLSRRRRVRARRAA